DMRLNYSERLATEILQGHAEDWDTDALENTLKEKLSLEVNAKAWVDELEDRTPEAMAERIDDALKTMMQDKETVTGSEQMRGFEKWLVLNVLDQHWKEHLLAMDHLRQSVGLRSYAQKQPLQEYKRESFELFSAMIEMVREVTMTMLHSVEIERPPEAEQPNQQEINYSRGEEADQAEAQQTYKREQPKVGRNDACPCGSGKKYKQCHGKR
ncbi:MAG: SEC-C metal-binding domain-containing protein, partial [Mariprofundaceae bacterium]